MTRLGHGLFTLILVWTLNACLLRSTAFAEPNDAVRILILNVVNKAGIPNKVLTPARDHVERIYRNIGIQIVWRMDGDEGMSEGNAIELTIVLLPPHLAGPFEQASACTGFAVGNDGRGARRAYVFSRRVNDQADQVLRKTHVPNLKTRPGARPRPCHRTRGRTSDASARRPQHQGDHEGAHGSEELGKGVPGESSLHARRGGVDPRGAVRTDRAAVNGRGVSPGPLVFILQRSQGGSCAE